MYTKLHEIFADKVGGDIFTCFGPWHFFYIFLTVAAVAISLYFMKNKGQEARDRLLKAFIGVAFGLYMLDFFIMPFAYGTIYVDKLPFHSCTLMSIMCFLSRNCKTLRPLRSNFALLGLLSNLAYLCYPAGVMWYEIGPLSYRVIQTLLFHSVMVMYCLLTILLDEGIKLKDWYRDLIILCSLTVWAILGNALYTGSCEDVGYYEAPNWFFVKQDPFYALQADIAPYIAPWLNIVAFLGAEVLIRLVYVSVTKKMAAKRDVSIELVAEECAVAELV